MVSNRFYVLQPGLRGGNIVVLMYFCPTMTKISILSQNSSYIVEAGQCLHHFRMYRHQSWAWALSPCVAERRKVASPKQQFFEVHAPDI